MCKSRKVYAIAAAIVESAGKPEIANDKNSIQL
jgi:hypothetical protein